MQCFVLLLLKSYLSLYVPITSLCVLSCLHPPIFIYGFMLRNFPFCVDTWCKVVYVLGYYTSSFTLYSFSSIIPCGFQTSWASSCYNALVGSQTAVTFLPSDLHNLQIYRLAKHKLCHTGQVLLNLTWFLHLIQHYKWCLWNTACTFFI